MHWITHTDPKQDGRYLVAYPIGHGFKVDVMNFTVAGGWNTFVLSDGTVTHSEAFKDDHIGTSNYLLGWQFLPKWGR